MDDCSLLESLALVVFRFVGIEGSLQDSVDEVGKSSFEFVGSHVGFHISLFGKSLDLSEGNDNHTSFGHQQSLQEVSLDVSDLSVLSEFVDGISNLSVLAVVEEILQNFQN